MTQAFIKPSLPWLLRNTATLGSQVLLHGGTSQCVFKPASKRTNIFDFFIHKNCKTLSWVVLCRSSFSLTWAHLTFSYFEKKQEEGQALVLLSSEAFKRNLIGWVRVTCVEREQSFIQRIKSQQIHNQETPKKNSALRMSQKCCLYYVKKYGFKLDREKVSISISCVCNELSFRKSPFKWAVFCLTRCCSHN